MTAPSNAGRRAASPVTDSTARSLSRSASRRPERTASARRSGAADTPTPTAAFVDDALRQGSARLTPVSPCARLDAEVLLANVCGLSRSQLAVNGRRALTPDQALRYQRLLNRRADGEPVAYLVGRREFWSLDLEITSDTLIPRPDTERLVERALVRIPAGVRQRIADLGTGSGAIALALATERPLGVMVATDISAAALRVAQRNAARLGIGNVEFARGDWLAALTTGDFDVVVANPPYVADGDSHLRHGDVRFEPPLALRGGRSGLDAIEAIIERSRAHLRCGGWLILEHGFDQAMPVRAAMRRARYRAVQSYRDLAGHERVTEGRV